MERVKWNNNFNDIVRILIPLQKEKKRITNMGHTTLMFCAPPPREYIWPQSDDMTKVLRVLKDVEGCSQPKLNQQLNSTEFGVRLHSYPEIHPTTKAALVLEHLLIWGIPKRP